MNNDKLYSSNIFELKLRVTYYARVSTDSNSQCSSIVNQNDFFNNYINNIDNWEYVPGYVDEGISGKDVKKRNNFLRMINDGINHKFDLILTKSVSRFARNTVDSIKYTDLLKSNGIGVFFINDNINTFLGDSEFRLTLMASIAQDEIRKLSDSVKFGLNESINRGVVLGNSNILGYKKNKGKLVIDDEEAKIVRDVFLLFVTDKYYYSDVAKIINNKYSKKFDSTSIKRILTNYKYKGYYCGRKSRVINYKNSKRISLSKDKWLIYKDNNNVPLIVSENIWNKANEIIKKRKYCYSNYNIYCGIHKKKYKYITKKYKNKYYRYYYCQGCGSFKKELIDKMCKSYVVKYIFIFFGNGCSKLNIYINI